jgi:hypothetical protein
LTPAERLGIAREAEQLELSFTEFRAPRLRRKKWNNNSNNNNNHNEKRPLHFAFFAYKNKQKVHISSFSSFIGQMMIKQYGLVQKSARTNIARYEPYEVSNHLQTVNEHK